eukprot:2553559-Rhodomonas_salina.1
MLRLLRPPSRWCPETYPISVPRSGPAPRYVPYFRTPRSQRSPEMVSGLGQIRSPRRRPCSMTGPPAPRAPPQSLPRVHSKISACA